MDIMKFFEKKYDEMAAAEAEYNNTDDEAIKAEMQEKYRTLMAEISTACSEFENPKAVERVYEAYASMRERGNDYLDFAIPDEDKMVALVSVIRDMEIKEFTYSSGWSGTVSVALVLKNAGCEITDVIEINSKHKKFMSSEYEKTAAYVYSIK